MKYVTLNNKAMLIFVTENGIYKNEELWSYTYFRTSWRANNMKRRLTKVYSLRMAKVKATTGEYQMAFEITPDAVIWTYDFFFF